MNIWYTIGGFGILVGGIGALAAVLWCYVMVVAKFVKKKPVKDWRNTDYDDAFYGGFALACCTAIIIAISYGIGSTVFG